MRSVPQFIFALCLCLFTAPVVAQEIVVIPYPAGCGNATGSAYTVTDLGEPLTFVWSPEPGGGQGTPYASGMAPGEYTITISDTLGVTLTETFTIEAIPGLFTIDLEVASWTTCGTSCDAGMCYHVPYVNGPFGQTPYSLVGAPDLSFNISGTCLEIFEICEGPGYEFLITDALGCTSPMSIGPVTYALPLTLLSTSSTPSCPDGATGSVQLLFDQPVVLANMQFWFDQATLHDLHGLPPGEYIFYAFNDLQCEEIPIPVTIEASSTGCGTITGTLYADLDGDCTQQSGEPGIPFRTITVSSDPQELIITNADGSFNRQFLLGAYSLDVMALGFDPLCPATLPIPFELATDGQVVTQDIAMAPLNGPDAFPTQISWGSAPGFEIPHAITVHNTGAYTLQDLELQFAFSPFQTLISSTIPPDASAPALLSWNIPLLQPFSTWSVELVIQLEADPELIGQDVVFVCTLVQSTPDAIPSNDVHSLTIPILGAYDPNDKTAFTSSGESQEHYYPAFDQHIDYVIRFQNTGNAPAHNVFILDTISPLLDASSLEILSASHPFEVQWQQDRALRFDFANIMLPDSVNNEAESHGFISFRLKPMPSIMIGDLISNAADIFFDYNPPIRTNTTGLLVSLPTSIQAVPTITRLSIHPNPSSTTIRVGGADLYGASWKVIGIDGRALLGGSSPMSEAVIDVSVLSRGTYIMRMTTTDGGVLQGKFIRE